MPSLTRTNRSRSAGGSCCRRPTSSTAPDSGSVRTRRHTPSRASSRASASGIGPYPARWAGSPPRPSRVPAGTVTRICGRGPRGAGPVPVGAPGGRAPPGRKATPAPAGPAPRPPRPSSPPPPSPRRPPAAARPPGPAEQVDEGVGAALVQGRQRPGSRGGSPRCAASASACAAGVALGAAGRPAGLPERGVHARASGAVSSARSSAIPSSAGSDPHAGRSLRACLVAGVRPGRDPPAAPAGPAAPAAAARSAPEPAPAPPPPARRPRRAIPGRTARPPTASATATARTQSIRPARSASSTAGRPAIARQSSTRDCAARDRPGERGGDLVGGHIERVAGERRGHLRLPAHHLRDQLRLQRLQPGHRPLGGRQCLDQGLAVGGAQVEPGQRWPQVGPLESFEHVFDSRAETVAASRDSTGC